MVVAGEEEEEEEEEQERDRFRSTAAVATTSIASVAFALLVSASTIAGASQDRCSVAVLASARTPLQDQYQCCT